MSESRIPVVRIKPRRALPFFSKHPWVFTGAIQSVSGLPGVGEQVVVRSHEGQFIGYGLFNPHSNIRVRMYSWSEERTIDSELLRERVIRAVEFRRKLFAGTSAERSCRLIFSEGDGLSGLTVDRFGDWLVVQWTSAALMSRADAIIPVLQELLAPRGIWLRTEKGIREQEGLEVEDGCLSGEMPPAPLLIEENGLTFAVDLQTGQKTGFYYDQRGNRAIVPQYLRGERMLDVCCYTGGFAIAAAARAGAEQVVAVDSSASALEIASANADRNGVADRIRWECDDAFRFVEAQANAGERYDLIVLDPPKLARTRSGLSRAFKAYIRLNRNAITCLNPDGILLTCSCSGLVSREDFEQVVAQAALESGREIQILESRGQAQDHPVAASCLESAYLKCLVCRVV